MGIPSYYKKLANNVPGLIRYRYPNQGAAVSWLFMDFNCLIYHCLHREDTPIYPGESGRLEWESAFIECIIQYVLRVVKQVNPQEGVYFAIDGVVPMAKMRQQRLRRFKSVWESTSESKWNTNAITPGTDFMKTLHEGLERMIRTQRTKGEWILSTSNEPGEGEHKIMAKWRTSMMHHKSPIAVYGLDADLVVLSLLGREQCHLQDVWLFRERMEEGKIIYEDGQEQFEWFSIHSLADWIVSVKQVLVLDYCFAMSILGNDFLPSSLGLKMRDDGHDVLMEVLQDSSSLLYPETYDILFGGLQSLFTILARMETRRTEHAIQKKCSLSYNVKKSSQPAMEKGEHNWPLQHVDEQVLLSPMTRQLTDDWKKRYQSQYFYGCREEDIAQSYLYGIQWIWAYYTGRMEDVCFNWYYPYALPPLWSWVVSALGKPSEFPGTVQLKAEDIRPVEQLALVLPLESWSLIPAHATRERRFPLLAPHFFPSEFGFESVGKRYFWECEAMIPLPSMVELKAILA